MLNNLAESGNNTSKSGDLRAGFGKITLYARREASRIQKRLIFFTTCIPDSIAPRLIPDIDVISLKGKSLLIIRVAHWPGPFYIKAKGSTQGVFNCLLK